MQAGEECPHLSGRVCQRVEESIISRPTRNMNPLVTPFKHDELFATLFRVAKKSFAFTIVVYLLGCSSETEKTVHWEEDVVLSSGAAVVVNRTQSYRRVSEPGQSSGWLFDKSSITARLPGKEQMHWSGQLQPLVIDFGPDKEIYLLATVETYRGLREYDIPEGVYHVAFKQSDTAWERIPLNSFPIELHPNLLASTYDVFIKRAVPSGSRVTVPAKLEFDSRATINDRYKGLIGKRHGSSNTRTAAGRENG